MDVKISTTDKIVTIAVEGSIDSNTAGDLQSKIMDKVAESQNVLLDFSKVDFVSSAGLRVLLMIYRQIKSKNGKVVLVGVSEEIYDVMSMTGFVNFFEITDTIENALKTL
ncbi:MAG: STAS domain-containing protein [Prolixibacteraceae bacterium]|nr:STAS domain-containing protein [Prolixibacteraceae bacterium]MBN2650145.1 STAS domain-containing protein [Prolixibacteraceae bacterium]